MSIIDSEHRFFPRDEKKAQGVLFKWEWEEDGENIEAWVEAGQAVQDSAKEGDRMRKKSMGYSSYAVRRQRLEEEILSDTTATPEPGRRGKPKRLW